jgi:hypothetical protein
MEYMSFDQWLQDILAIESTEDPTFKTVIMAYFNKYITSQGDDIKGKGIKYYKEDTCQAWKNDGHKTTSICSS